MLYCMQKKYVSDTFFFLVHSGHCCSYSMLGLGTKINDLFFYEKAFLEREKKKH